MLYFIKLRELGIKDVTLARHLSSFIKQNALLTLSADQEFQFVRDLVYHHPTNQKDFEHFLIDPPKGILPSQVLQELHQRSAMIPTICVIITEYNKSKYECVSEIFRLKNHYQLMSLLMNAREKGWIANDVYPLQSTKHIKNEVAING